MLPVPMYLVSESMQVKHPLSSRLQVSHQSSLIYYDELLLG